MIRDMKIIPTDDPRITYAAGLWDGEGSIQTPGRGACMSISMTDREPLDTIQDILGGSISGPHARGKAHWKPQYIWRITTWLDVMAAAKAIRPYVCPRRQEQIDSVLSKAPAHPRGTHACPAVAYPTSVGYTRHLALGTEPCEVCVESMYLFRRQYHVKRHPGAPERRYRMGKVYTPELCCPDEPIVSSLGYVRHRKLGIPPCDICRKSHSLYVADLAKRKRDARRAQLSTPRTG